MAGARRLSVFHRRIELGLSATALELVFAAPRVVSEGGADGERYVGSTTITIDLTSDYQAWVDNPATGGSVAASIPAMMLVMRLRPSSFRDCSSSNRLMPEPNSTMPTLSRSP